MTVADDSSPMDDGGIETSVVTLSAFHWPTPPPSPPLLPPLPPPERRLNATSDQLECQFEQGIDLSVSSTASKPSAAHAVDTQQQCCALCALKTGCTRFVFIPGSGVCALLPHVPKLEIVRISNPATVAGHVFLARAELLDGPVRPHARCQFEVGFGYAKGALGAGRPLDEPSITSQQACCDACERNHECVKFVFEKYGGGCQLFESFSEKYRTPGLIAGLLPSRLALGYSAQAADEMQPPTPPPFVAAPAPPTLGFSIATPPPFPPPEGGTAEVVLAYASIVMGGFMVVAFFLCTYCFYFGEIQGLLHQWTRGRYGKAKFALLPKSLQELERASAGQGSDGAQTIGGKTKKKKTKDTPLLAHKGPAAGLASVTCETEHVSQKKQVHVAECETVDELLTACWEEFGHVLKAVRQKDMTMLCLVPGTNADSDGEWMLITKASDLAQVTSGHALKLAAKKLLSNLDTRPVAFANRLVDKKRSGQFTTSGTASHVPPPALPQDLMSIDVKADLPIAAGAAAAVAEEVEGESGKDDDGEEEKEEEEGRPIHSRSLRAVEGWSEEGHDDAPPRLLDDPDSGLLHTMQSWQRQRPKRTNAFDVDEIDRHAGGNGAALDDEPLVPGMFGGAARMLDDGTESSCSRMLTDTTGRAEGHMIGQRVRICNLQSMGELNGRTGVVVGFDANKGRYRVRFDDVESGTRVLAFRADNLEATESCVG